MDRSAETSRGATRLRCALTLLILLGPSASLAESPATAASPSVDTGSVDTGDVRVELLTMEPGPKFHSAFGHTALRVRSPEADLVYNFGYTSFSDPWLAFNVAFGKAVFWAGRRTFANTVRAYARRNRTLFRQELNLTPQQHRKLADILATTATGRASRYRYHHYYNNCATRPRDAIDEVIGGAIGDQLKGRPLGLNLRQLTRQGFSHLLPLLLFTDYMLGRVVDHPIDWWEAAFLPRLLTEGLEQVRVNGGPLVGPRIMLNRRSTPLPKGDPRGAVWVITALAMMLTLLAGLTGLFYRQRRRIAGALLVVVVLVLGVLSLPPWLAVIFAALRTLWINEIALILWPTDLLLVTVGWRWLRGRFEVSPRVRKYVLARVSVVALALVGQALGLLVQRPLVWLAVVGLPMLLLHLALRGVKRPAATRKRR